MNQSSKHSARARVLQVAASVAFAASLLLAAPGSVRAAAWEDSVAPNNFAPTTERASISVERAVRIVRKQTGGRVLAANPSQRQGRQGVEVRILLDDGSRVSTLFVDAEGRVRRR